ncbi:MAG TPA: nitroreductase family protein [Acidimicrobiia bacterium]|jgi:nitroreductase
METWDAITSRRQVRSFTDQPIPDGILRHILDGARLSPSGSNRQPWDFVVVSDQEQKKRLSAVWRGAAFTAGAASVVALTLPVVDDDDRALMNRFDIGQAALQLTVVAADQGIGSGLAACRDQDLARKVLGLPDDRFVAILVALGYPGDRPMAPIKNLDRRPFDEVVHFDRW